MTYTIRAEQDPVAVLALDEICFPADTRVNLADSFWWIVWLGKDAVGYAGLRPCQSPCNAGVGFLCRAGILPEHRGKGLQKRLIKIREIKARQLGLNQLVTYCVPSNFPSINSLIACRYRLYQPTTRWGGSYAIYLHKLL